ncbi:ribosome biogenesis regulatory protein homolog [Dendronephthya gigantea]|uniref:ribosome biogenesis regulatory protein homolog n=1 Tax=Dendronephthya gigantea TaxID=151771 RepID=UPI00106BC4A4|nr:ribosome biogenesis regulatory protein homolog [Dendronephthya gigantea]
MADKVVESEPSNAMDIDEIISASKSKNDGKYKTIEVNKLVEPQTDIGNLLVTDINLIETKNFKRNKDEILKTLARDNTQFLFNAIWKLPIEKSENVMVVKLPEASTVLPREKPIPKPKPLTKWQEFAKRKGIRKQKRGRMLWDETSQTWKPRWGFKRAKDDTKEWLIEVPGNADPYEDQFLKREQAKKERVSKNEYQRLRNIGRSQKMTEGTKLAPTQKPTRNQVKATINAARISTASMGKFTPKLRNETLPKKSGTKRKYEPIVGDLKAEKQRNLDLLGKIGNKQTLDVKKATNQHINQEQTKASDEKKKGGKRQKTKSAGKGKGGNVKQAKKPRGKR